MQIAQPFDPTYHSHPWFDPQREIDPHSMKIDLRICRFDFPLTARTTKIRSIFAPR